MRCAARLTSRPLDYRGPPAGFSERAFDDDRLGVGVVVKRFGSMLLTVAARLQASERQLVVDLGGRVDPRVSAVKLGGDPLGGLQVLGPDRRAESERRVVRAGD